MSNVASIWKNEGGSWTKMIVPTSAAYGVGFIYETTSTTETIETLASRYGGTWEALSDRSDSVWKTYNITCASSAGTGDLVRCMAKCSPDKSYVELEVSLTLTVNSVASTTSEIEALTNIRIEGTSIGTLTVVSMPMTYTDNNNCAQTASAYISAGSQKLWFGPNKTGGFYGRCIGRMVIPYNDIFAPDITYKRFKRTA